MNLIEALAFGVKGNLSIPRDQEFAHAALRVYGMMLAKEDPATTIIAAQMTKRRCLAIEIDPAYCDLGVLRWQAFTGQMAVLESTGRSFEETMADRKAPKAKRGASGARRGARRRAPAQSR